MFEERYDANDLYLEPIYAAKPGMKHARAASTSNSATSRRNKLQRCSNCGGLGHKSRTCDQASQKTIEPEDSRDQDGRPSRPFQAPESSHDLTVLAAYGLLSLQAQGMSPLQARLSPPQQQQPQPAATSIFLPATPPCSPQRMGMSPQQHWQPLSPTLLAT